MSRSQRWLCFTPSRSRATTELKRVTTSSDPGASRAGRRVIGRAGDPRGGEHRCSGCDCGCGRSAALPSRTSHFRPGLAGVGQIGTLRSWTCSAASLAPCCRCRRPSRPRATSDGRSLVILLLFGARPSPRIGRHSDNRRSARRGERRNDATENVKDVVARPTSRTT